ncbi:sigma-54-dependent transcriptional regulator [Aliikangiella coralliicola]|uniref:Sigma-54-dependent Fis family transcriptional regulator n=1 Tax=Aliikangiella coralliicola TaxID=2592383 RepID=A0A545UB96_9GAMM|nr:sigma-54 dependent transcriptional regulator [Aliikangiella coralliicola]TQV86727.1 sigma-54-dependent Fis family transcriptional regulator [Aliikangiella coralliicola]
MNSSVLIVEDDHALRNALMASLKISGYQTTAADSAESALSILNEERLPDMVVTDIQMGDMSGIDLLKNLRRKKSNMPVILMTAYGEISDAVEAMRLGACDYLQKPFEASRLTELIENYLPKKKHSEIIVADPVSKKLFEFAEKIAQTESNVLLSGPSGAGKEVMARFVHLNSTRKDHPFVAINCAAIPENMLEATLFGYEKGAFTGAHQACAGKFEQAQKGTLLLDEISEMDLALQAKLLRVIQEKEVERIGGKKTIKLDVRIIATTNRDLKQEVADNQFREDLYYRLNVFPIRCLALKDRPSDIIPLTESMLENNEFVQSRGGLSLSNEAKAKLVAYSWPGNVRELDNLVQRVAVLANESIVTADDIQFENEINGELGGADNVMRNDGESQLVNHMQHHEFQLIIEALEKHNGKKKDVAEGLGISPRTLRYKLARMRELGYEIPSRGAR